LSNKKKNNKKSKLKKQNEYTLKRLYSGDIISYHEHRPLVCTIFSNGRPEEIRYGIVIDVHGGKKKWLREYKILTEYSVWTLHPGMTMNYTILKVE